MNIIFDGIAMTARPGQWIPWECSPPPERLGCVQCMRRGSDEVFTIDLKLVSPYWNIAGVYWRVPHEWP